MKKILAVTMALLMILLAACGGGTSEKTVNTREEVKTLAEEFYGPLKSVDTFKLSSYYDGELVTVLTKEQDKFHMEMIDEEYGYDYYGFIEDGKKYIVTDDRTLFEDEGTYSMSEETINILLQMNVFGFLEEDIDGISYSATAKGDNELVITLKGDSEGEAFTNTVTGKKDGGNITEIVSETISGEETMSQKYEFAYGEHVEIPEYNVPVSYDNMPHVESPYKTYGEIISQLGEEDYMDYMFMGEQLIVIGEKDGRHYQFSTAVTPELMSQYDALDIMDDDYTEQVYKLLTDVEIEDCIDFTDILMSKEEADAYIGRDIQSMVEEGFEISGYSFWEDTNIIFISKDYITYDASVELPEGFDAEGEFEYEDLGPAVVKGIEYNSLEPAALPMS